MSSVDTPVELHLPIPAQHACFPDHFPGAPLVPGALLLKWVIELLAQQQWLQVKYIKQVKFLAPVKPGEQLRLYLTPGKKSFQVSIDAYVDQTAVFKGQFKGSLIGIPSGPAHD